MINKFADYLDDIGIGVAIIARVDRLIEMYKSFNSEAILDIFVTEYTQEDGGRVYQNLWLFSPNFVMEISNFIGEGQEEFDMVKKQRLYYWTITKRNFDLVKSTRESVMSITAQMEPLVTISINASGNNCEYLLKIIKLHFKLAP